MNQLNIGYGKATGKIILMGEHAVVYGEPAIAFPFKETTIIATIAPSQSLTLNCQYFSGKVMEVPSHLQNIKEAILQTLERLNQRDTQLAITITSTIPSERGMGSSAAAAVATIRALFDYFSFPYTNVELLELVNHAEKIAHGNPSGIDAAATSGQEPILFVKGQPFQTFPMNMTETFLIVADTGIKGQTRHAVSDVANLLEQEKKQTSQKIAELGRLTNVAKDAILKDDCVPLGQYMNEAQALLQSLTVSNEQLDQLIQTANRHGALGSKLTGGGRGGCMIALSDSREQALHITHSLRAAGAKKTWIQSLEVEK